MLDALKFYVNVSGRLCLALALTFLLAAGFWFLGAVATLLNS